MNFTFNRPFQTSLSQHQSFLICILFVILLAGKFEFSRIHPFFVSLSFLDEITFSIFYVLLIILVAGLPTSWRPTSFKTPAIRWSLLVVCLHLYLILSIFWTPDPILASSNLPQLLELVMLILLFPYVMRSPEDSIKFFVKLLFGASIIYALAGFTGIWSTSGRMTAFWGGPNVFVRIVSNGVVIGLYFWFITRRMYWLLPTPLLLSAAFLSGSRGGVFGLFVTIGFFFIFMYRRYTISLKFIFLLIIVSGSTFGVLFFTPLFPYLSDRFVGQILGNFYWSTRDLLFLEAWGMFINNPMLGVGAGGYPQLTVWKNPDGTPQPYPHNLILQIAAEGGTLGLIILIFIFISMFLRLYRPKLIGQELVFCLGLYYFLVSMFSGGLIDARFVWFFWSCYMSPATEVSEKEYDGPNFTN